MIWQLSAAVAASVAAFLVLLLALALLWPRRAPRPAREPPAGRGYHLHLHGPLTREQLDQVTAHREIGH